MAVILTDFVEGKKPGDTYSGDREDFLLANGHARTKTAKRDRVNDSGVALEKDATLAKNREPAEQSLTDYHVENQHQPNETDTHTTEGDGGAADKGAIEDKGNASTKDDGAGESTDKGAIEDRGFEPAATETGDADKDA